MIEFIITSSVLIIAVIALRYLCKGKISLRLQYAIWALVLVRLLIPVTLFESSFSVMNAVQAAISAREASETSPPAPTLSSAYGGIAVKSAAVPVDTEQNITDSITNKYHHVFRWGLLALWIWGIGIGIVGMTLLFSNLGFGRKLRKAGKPYQAEDCKLPVYILDALPSPCLFGFFRPSIYITPDVAGDETKLRHVLAHELTHYRHGDPIWSAMRGLCLAVHWYNPLVWLAAALSRHDAELACDEGTIKRIGEENRMAYGRTLIGLTCEQRSTKDLLCCATTMTAGKREIAERIALIAKKPKPLWPAVIVVVLVAVVAAGCTFTRANTDENKTIPLTADEVELYNKTFEPLLDDGHGNYRVNPLSHFLTSYYDRPEDINLHDFLYVFPSEDITGEAEFEALKDTKNWPFGTDATLDGMPVPIHKFPADTINDALKTYMGIALKDLSGAGQDELIYLKEYDAYYNFTSDFATGTIACTSGERQSDTVRLYSKHATLTLKLQGDGFLIVSHQRVGETAIPQTAIDNTAEYLSQQAVLEPPLLTSDMSVGIGVIPDYVGDDILIFHGYFGLFVYDLKAEKITFSADLKKAVGTTFIQGSEYAAVCVSPDGNTIQLYYDPAQGDPLTAYVIDSHTGNYSYDDYTSLDAYNTSAADLYDRFSQGTLGELTYSDGKNSWLLFANWDWAD